MWLVVETLSDILSGIDEDPHLIVITKENDKYKAKDIMIGLINSEVQREDFGELMYVKYDSQKMMAKIVYEQTVIVIGMRKIDDK